MDEYEEELESMAKFGLKKLERPGGRLPNKVFYAPPKPIIQPAINNGMPKIETVKEDLKTEVKKENLIGKKGKKKRKQVVIKV